MQRKALLIASGLLARGHEVDLLALRPDCDYPEEIPGRCRLFLVSANEGNDPGIPKNLKNVSTRTVVPERASWHRRCQRAARLASHHWKQLPFLVRTEPRGWAKGVSAYLERECPDAVLAMHVRSVAATIMAIRLADRHVRVVATLHKLFGTKGRQSRISSFYPCADVLVGISAKISAGLARIAGVPTDQIRTIYNPIVSAALIEKACEPVDHPWLNGTDRPVVLAAGRLVEEKGFHTLLSAFAMLFERRDVRLIVLGKGPELSGLLSQAEDLGVRQYVDFPGFVTNPYAYMAKANLFVLSSRVEGLPTVLVEAMACGCPVVSTDCPFGPAEILEEGRLGELVSVGDPRALADAMDRTLNLPPDRSALLERAKCFGVEQAIDQYEALLLDEPSRHG